MTSPSARKPVSDLKPRIASAIVLIAVAGAVTWIGGTVFALAMVALAGVLYFEWVRMTMLPTQTFSVVFGAIVLAGSSIWLAAEHVSGSLWFATVGAIALMLIVHFKLFPNLSLTRAKWVVGGLAYALSAATSLIVIRGQEATIAEGERGLVLLAFLFLVVWATDILAYFVGRSVGGPKLLPAVSPKKTISGALGGVAGAVGVGIVFAVLLDTFSLFGAIAVAIVLSAVSQCGDLFESWIKRRYRVKDSSNLIPGHGGFMDRVDGLVFAAVPLALYVSLT